MGHAEAKGKALRALEERPMGGRCRPTARETRAVSKILALNGGIAPAPRLEFPSGSVLRRPVELTRGRATLTTPLNRRGLLNLAALECPSISAAARLAAWRFSPRCLAATAAPIVAFVSVIGAIAAAGTGNRRGS